MVSATDFLPLTMTWFMNFAKVTLPNLGSGSTSRLATMRLLGMIITFLSSGDPNTDLPQMRRQGFGLTYIVSVDTLVELTYLGRLAPYLERPLRRSETPEVSRLPRTV